jgi:hypothetical protein
MSEPQKAVNMSVFSAGCVGALVNAGSFTELVKTDSLTY